VHPRRNDRFLRAGPLLQRLYPEVDFSQFNFTHHMLKHLHQLDSARFGPVRDALQSLWLRRMRKLVAKVSDEVVLVRFVEAGLTPDWRGGRAGCPALITDDMLDLLAVEVSAIIEVPIDDDTLPDCRVGMVFDLADEQAAGAVSPPQAHTAAARMLRPVLDRLM
jgi:hypothetical protein